MYKLIIILLIILPVCEANSQNPKDSAIRAEFPFVNHLFNKSFYDDAFYYLNKLDTVGISANVSDSINYFKGWAMYNLKELDSSALFLMKVSDECRCYEKSRFFAAYNYAFLRKYETSKDIFTFTNTGSMQSSELKLFEFAGISLLERNLQEYTDIKSRYQLSFYAIDQEKENLDRYYIRIKNFKPKSMLLAGALSGIIPGSGKIYAGKTGEGIAALLMVGSLGAITAENYIKSSPKNWKTIVFGTAFTIFYIGNIYGSVFSIKFRRNDFNKQIDDQILFDLHIPLRTIYN